MKGLFNDNGMIGVLDAVDLKQIDNVSPFVGLVFEKSCAEKDTAPDSKAFTAYAALLLLLREKHDPWVNSKKLKIIQAVVWAFSIVARKAFQDFHSMVIVKWHYLITL